MLGLTGGLISAGSAQAVSGGSAAPNGSWGFVAKVDVGGARACTGALVSSRWVITARSCLSVGGQPVTAGSPALPTTVTVGRSDLSSTGGRVLPVLEVVPHPDRDVALLRLGLQILDVAPVPVSDSAPDAGEAVRFAGYGRTTTEWVPTKLHTAEVELDAVVGDSFTWSGRDSNVSACKGDAGGPVFRETAGQPQLVGLNVASWQGGCLGETSTRYGATAARVDDLKQWITRPGPSIDFVDYHTSANGIGGYDLTSPADQVVPFDYSGSGKPDHLLMYRPGSGIVFIAKHVSGGGFEPVFRSFSGIGSFSLGSVEDRLVPFDYDGSGKLDDLLAYRPG
ncbi:trypsin-like serine protease, partial [Micromonospora arborensis]|uniref:S1 family peptidase n=1 Tax=Micromonospora arborensis TaxID=2116518 RepID=UPI003401B03D